MAGATSYVALRTVQGADGQERTFPTFKDTATELGLLEDDKEWDICMREAASMQRPNKLRQLFATLLLFSYPTQPCAFWDAHLEALTEDYLHTARGVRTLTPQAYSHIAGVDPETNCLPNSMHPSNSA